MAREDSPIAGDRSDTNRGADSREITPGRDYTKTTIYVAADLLLKTISALGIVSLGIAGWLLQSHAEQSREAVDRLDRQERKYLPMLRSLSELEAAIDIAIYDRYSEQVDPAEEDRRVSLAGIQLRYIAYSVIVPDGDPRIVIRQNYVHGPGDPTRRVETPLRAASLMLSDVMRAREYIRQYPGTEKVRLDTNQSALVHETTGHGWITLSRDALPAWRSWLGQEPVPLDNIVRVNVIVLAEDVNFGIAETLRAALLRHPDLGDRYIMIRSDIAKEKSALLRAPAIDTQANTKAAR